jgi:hypothetical protein
MCQKDMGLKVDASETSLVSVVTGGFSEGPGMGGRIGSGGDLRRPYIRKEVKKKVADNQPKTGDGKFIDPNTGKPIESKPDLGHKPGQEHWREVKQAKEQGLSQKEFNDKMNDPSKYHYEDASSNRSHRYEQK